MSESRSLPGQNLSWCANAMALMNGGINVTVNNGGGVGFHLCLPA